MGTSCAFAVPQHEQKTRPQNPTNPPKKYLANKKQAAFVLLDTRIDGERESFYITKKGQGVESVLDLRTVCDAIAIVKADFRDKLEEIDKSRTRKGNKNIIRINL